MPKMAVIGWLGISAPHVGKMNAKVPLSFTCSLENFYQPHEAASLHAQWLKRRGLTLGSSFIAVAFPRNFI
jgi:hypothetical protein